MMNDDVRMEQHDVDVMKRVATRMIHYATFDQFIIHHSFFHTPPCPVGCKPSF